MELSPRLEKITTLIPKGSTLADLGTDHAYIPVYCAKNKITKSYSQQNNQNKTYYLNS